MRSRQLEGGSERTINEVQKPTKFKAERKVVAIQEEEASQGSVAPLNRRAIDYTADQPLQKKEKDGRKKRTSSQGLSGSFF